MAKIYKVPRMRNENEKDTPVIILYIVRFERYLIIYFQKV